MPCATQSRSGETDAYAVAYACEGAGVDVGIGRGVAVGKAGTSVRVATGCARVGGAMRSGVGTGGATAVWRAHAMRVAASRTPISRFRAQSNLSPGLKVPPMVPTSTC